MIDAVATTFASEVADSNIVSTRIVLRLPSDFGDQSGGVCLPRLGTQPQKTSRGAQSLEWRAYSTVVCSGLGKI